MHGVTWRAVPAKFETGHLPGAIWRAVVAKPKRKDLWCIFGTLVQHELAHVRGETWRALPAKFETRMCEMKSLRSEDL